MPDYQLNQLVVGGVGKHRFLLVNGHNLIENTSFEDDIDGWNENNIVLCSSHGTGQIFFSGDNGEEWVDVDSGFTPAYMWPLVYCDGGIVLAGDFDDKIYRSTDFGLTWSVVKTGYYVVSFSYLGNGIVLAGTQKGGAATAVILRSTDWGLTWTSEGNPAGVNTEIIRCIIHYGAGVVTCGTQSTAFDSRICRSTDWGDTWTDLGDLGEVDVWCMIKLSGDATDALAGTSTGGEVYSTSDAGLNWTNEGQLGTESIIYCFAEDTDTDRVFAGGDDGNYYYSDDRGDTWSAAQNFDSGNPNLGIVRSMIFLENGILLAAVDEGATGGIIFRSTDDGATWVESTSNASVQYFNLISMVESTTAYLTRSSDADTQFGNYCLKIKDDSTVIEEFAYFVVHRDWGSGDSMAGKKYCILFWAKGDAVSIGSVRMDNNSSDPADRNMINEDIGLTTEWKPYFVVGTCSATADGDTIIVRIEPYDITGDYTDIGTMYIDGIEFYEISWDFQLKQASVFDQEWEREDAASYELIGGDRKIYRDGSYYAAFLDWEYLEPSEELVKSKVFAANKLIFVPHMDYNWAALVTTKGNNKRSYFFNRYIGHKGGLQLMGLHLLEQDPPEIPAGAGSGEVIGSGSITFEDVIVV